MRKLLFSILFTITLLPISFETSCQTYYSGEQGQKLDWALFYLNTEYVDSVNSEKLAEEAVKAIVGQLDPYSSYQTKAELDSQQSRDKGHSYVGIGINFFQLEDTVFVTNVVPFGPASKAGVQLGDKLISASGQSLVSISQQRVVDILRGEKDSSVEVELYRGKQRIRIDIVRDQIPLVEIPSAYLVEEDIGYIKVNNFTTNTLSKFTDSLQSLGASGAKQLIIDLRGNPGGLVKSAVALSDLFLEEGKLLLYTEGHSMERVDHVSKTSEDGATERIVLLIDKNTASASEIFSGALQDWDRALVLGQESYGKGLVQQSYLLGDGSAIRLTIGRYYTPAGRFIQRPSIGGKFINKSIDYGQARGGFTSQISVPDSLIEYSLSKRRLIGGGGITPDIHVAADSTFISVAFNQLSYDVQLYGLCQKILSDHRHSLLKANISIDAFSQSAEASSLLWSVLQDQVIDLELELSNYEKQRSALLTQMKAWIAAGLWGNNAYYKIINQEDASFRRAVSEIKKQETFRRIGLRY